MLNKFVMSMASLRVLSGTIEICAALLDSGGAFQLA